MSIDVRHLDLADPHGSAEDRTIADRVRSELGSLVKTLDQPRIHVLVSDGIVSLHGDVTDLAAAAAIEARARRVTGVRNVHSRLHVGLLPGDTVPSVGHQHQRSPLRTQLDKAASDAGFWSEQEIERALPGLLGVFSQRLSAPARERFLAHLPADVRTLARPPRWLEDKLTSVRREHDFAQTVALAVGTDTTRADTLIRHLLPPLRRHAPEDARLIADALPPEVRAIWLEHPSGASTRRVPRLTKAARRRADATDRRGSSAAEDRRVSDIMTRDLISLPPEGSIFSAFELMRRHRIRHLPVVRSDGHCVAILDAVTIAERMPKAWVTRGTEPAWRPNGAVGPLSVLPNSSLRRAATQMHDADVDACCVVDEHGRLIGLLTCHDMIAALAGRTRHDER